MTCENCSRYLDKTKVVSFCPYCGVKLSENDNIPSVLYSENDISTNIPLGYTKLQVNAPGVTSGLIFGVIGFMVAGIIFGLVALIMGIKAKGQIRTKPELYTGAGMATAAIALGIIDIIWFFFVQIPMMQNW